jgi:hypothetical protein|tara:strand:- start:14 stop:241 length:228 start_codon:yes stop_codon:yes gene_type:complete
MIELPPLDELIAMLDVAREGGYDGTLETLKYDLLNRPEVIPFPRSMGPDFSQGGLVNKLLMQGIGKFFKQKGMRL